MDKFPQPKQAMDFLSGKVNVPTERWDELKQGEHSHCFTVAHSTLANILDDIHGLLNKAISEGQDFQSWRREFLETMRDKGWYGREDKGPEDKGYMNWWGELIFHTNMKTAYSAQGYRQALEAADLRPLWVYMSMLVGANRRQEHIALHNKGFRYDDPFWDTNYPPNGFGCECKIMSMSEVGAKREGVEVLASGTDGKPPELKDRQGKPIDWDKFTQETWRYNPGKESLAPNFSKYTNLPKETFTAVKDNYRQHMEKTRISFGQLKKLHDAMKSKDYQFTKKRAINYQIGNLEKERFETLGLDDSKIMISEERIYHAFREKGDATIPDDCMLDAYDALQQPELIFEEKRTRHKEAGRIFHFVKDTKNRKIINAVVEIEDGVALKVRTIDLDNLKKLLGSGDLNEVWSEKK
jgi:uncharacterized protein with gpF-like domain